MSNEELKAMLHEKRWDMEMRQKLVDEWNERRGDVKKINLSSVRTPCRLRQIIGSMLKYLQEKD